MLQGHVSSKDAHEMMMFMVMPCYDHAQIMLKYKANTWGVTIEKYKTRLVAKGYTQKEGEDYFDTYSPVARLMTIRVLLSLAASHGLLVHQMNVKTTFLNGEPKEEIYMDQPNEFIAKG
jgi:hypothetical protein